MAGGRAVGNPINPSTGMACKIEDDIDYLGTAKDVGLSPFKRFYSSIGTSSPPGSLGRSWRHSFDRRIQWLGSNSAFVIRNSGQVLFFELIAGQWKPDSDIADKLLRLTDGGGNHIGWEYLEADSEEREKYNATGSLIEISSRNGLTQTLTYSDGSSSLPTGGVIEGTSTPLPSGLLVSVTSSQGHQITFGYDQKSRVTRVNNPGDTSVQYTYNSNNNLTSVIHADGTTRQYLYNEPAFTNGVSFPRALTGIIDEKGNRSSTFTYNNAGLAIATENAGGANRVTLSYALNSTSTKTTTVTDALGTARAYTFQTLLHVPRNVSVNPPCENCGGAATTGYGSNALADFRVDWNGNRTSYSYDLARNLETSRIEGLTAAGAPTPTTRTINTQWHSVFRLPVVITEPLRKTTLVYNGDGGASCGLKTDGITLVPGVLCSKTVQATTDIDGSAGLSAITTGISRVWVYTYNANGSVLTINGPRTDVADVTTYTYHANNATCAGASAVGCRGQIATITNAASHATSITNYNAHGQPLTIVDPNGLTTTLVYDARQRLTSRTVGSEVTSYTYDNVGQLTKVILPDTSFLSYTYDAAHRLTQITDNLGNKIVYTLDLMGNRTQEQVFDPSNALALTRSRVYNSLNRLTQEIGASSQTTAYTYDNQGNVTQIDGPLAGTTDVTVNAYDALNRLTQMTNPLSGVVGYSYNGVDQLTSVTDPRSLVTSYSYDGLNNLNQQVSPDTGTTANTYDAAGNLLTSTDAKSQVTTYTYDVLNRVASITYQGGVVHSYTYDQGTNGKGRLTQISEPNSVTAYAYDPQGRLLNETRTINGVPYVTAYGYDSAGRMNSVTYPSGRVVNYTLDALGRIQSVATTKDSATQTVVSSVAYRPFGPSAGFTFGNGQTYSRGFDQDGRIASYTLATQSIAVGYDTASRITSLTDTGTPTNTNTYGYDTLDRLTSFTGPSTNQGYTFDATGNRLTKTVGANTDTYTYSGSSNKLSTIAGTTNRSYTHDANGSATADTARTYAYDTRGRMVQTTGVGGTSTYQVNSVGQRIRKTNTAGDTIYHYDAQGRLISETSSSGTPQREYIYLGDTPVAVIQ